MGAAAVNSTVTLRAVGNHWHFERIGDFRVTENELCHCFQFTGSQTGQGWKGPLWVTQSNTLPKQGHPEQTAQDLVQAGLEYLQRRRLYNLPGQPVPGLRHPQREEVLPHVQMELPVPQ